MIKYENKLIISAITEVISFQNIHIHINIAVNKIPMIKKIEFCREKVISRNQNAVCSQFEINRCSPIIRKTFKLNISSIQLFTKKNYNYKSINYANFFFIFT